MIGLRPSQPNDDYKQLVDGLQRADTTRGTQEYTNFLGKALKQQVPRLKSFISDSPLKRELVMGLEFLAVPYPIPSVLFLLHFWPHYYYYCIINIRAHSQKAL